MSNHNTTSMHGMKIDRHPIVWVAQVLSPWANGNGRVHMSQYNYVPQSFNDYRFEFYLPIINLNENTLVDILISMDKGMELAMHSKIILDGNVYHFPMIDFGTKCTNPVASETIKELCRYWNMAFNIYASGRSFHAYGNRLLTQDEWLQFMGSLLLLNKPSGYKLIDERWVGHRIMGGYSALRWSKNTSHYKKFPTHCGFVSGDDFVIENISKFPI
ncbi:hypothetical protein [Proteus faecis]|uniref:primase 1D-like protein n=1 Tax=Proteus faecis TaxID=2050967 RepID=UPI0018C5CAAF|nr:hypothetical protein [Proteus faecis]MBG3014551.1 hypothetical protein [Proteus mirabilis]